MTETRDDGFELPPEELGDGSGTLGPDDDTTASNLRGFFGEATDSDENPPLPYMLGPGDITINTDLAGLDGASTDAIQLPEGRFDLGSKLAPVSYTHLTLPTKA